MRGRVWWVGKCLIADRRSGVSASRRGDQLAALACMPGRRVAHKHGMQRMQEWPDTGASAGSGALVRRARTATSSPSQPIRSKKEKKCSPTHFFVLQPASRAPVFGAEAEGRTRKSGDKSIGRWGERTARTGVISSVFQRFFSGVQWVVSARMASGGWSLGGPRGRVSWAESAIGARSARGCCEEGGIPRCVRTRAHWR